MIEIEREKNEKNEIMSVGWWMWRKMDKEMWVKSVRRKYNGIEIEEDEILIKKRKELKVDVINIGEGEEIIKKIGMEIIEVRGKGGVKMEREKENLGLKVRKRGKWRLKKIEKKKKKREEEVRKEVDCNIF